MGGLRHFGPKCTTEEIGDGGEDGMPIKRGFPDYRCDFKSDLEGEKRKRKGSSGTTQGNREKTVRRLGASSK